MATSLSSLNTCYQLFTSIDTLFHPNYGKIVMESSIPMYGSYVFYHLIQNRAGWWDNQSHLLLHTQLWLISSDADFCSTCMQPIKVLLQECLAYEGERGMGLINHECKVCLFLQTTYRKTLQSHLSRGVLRYKSSKLFFSETSDPTLQQFQTCHTCSLYF